ncbi:hypothetical protein EV182_008043 [Spiromyces aspiralis]|uniref:Uncharacterized protein n=1 Tax=Spiromyces aspiralis TaxID=68401 RepID=A0ACC1HKG9_9FUNG|nr:hypothetical protein EV182_008043 [Spiromyces aspiralis]
MAANAQLGHNSPLKALRAMGHHRSRREREAHALYQGNLTRSSRNQAGLGGDDDQQQHEQYVYQSSMLYPVPPKLVKVRHNPDGSQTYLSASDNEGDDATNELHKLDFEQDALSDPSTDELFNEARSVEGDYNYPVIELGVVFGYGRRASYEQLPRHRQASAGASIPPPTSDSSGRLTREHRLNYGSIV